MKKVDEETNENPAFNSLLWLSKECLSLLVKVRPWRHVLPMLHSCDRRCQPWLLGDRLETSRGAVGGGRTEDSAERLSWW